MTTYRTHSSEETERLGSDLARRTRNIKPGRRAFLVALSGELGSGKTTFVRGFLRAVGIRGRAASPTFIIVRRLPLKRRRFGNVFHVDFYRIKKPNELLTLGLREILADPKNIVLIEWADKVRRFLPRPALTLGFRHGKAEHDRIVSVTKQ